jgi:hypothetical protein
MKLSTAVGVLDTEAAWLGISGAELLVDIAQHGRILYSDRVVVAYTRYQDYFESEAAVAGLEAQRDNTIDTVVS